MAARTAIVCVLLWGVTALADRRHVAVVDLTGGDGEAEALAAALRSELIQHDELQPVSDVSAEDALKGVMLDEDAQSLATARADKKQADDELLQSNFPDAARAALHGQQQLLGVTPTAAVPIYADLAFALGQAYVGEGKLTDAAMAFTVTHRLTPGRVLDPSRFYPDVVTAYDDAGTALATAGTTTLAVTGSGEIWIDGVSQGAAPREGIAVTAGSHLVQLTGPTRIIDGVTLVVEANKPAAVSIADAPAPAALQVRRVRMALARAPDAAAHASLMAQLAKLIEVGDAVLLSKVDGKLLIQTWRDRAPGFSSLQEQGTKKPLDLLTPLSPPKPKVILVPVPVLQPVEIEHWYTKTSVKIAAPITAVAIIIGAILWARSGTKFQDPTGNISF